MPLLRPTGRALAMVAPAPHGPGFSSRADMLGHVQRIMGGTTKDD
jgi:hypothetical protein